MSPPIRLYEKLPAACHDYDPRSPAVAQRVALLITERLPGVTVEHIGSSSVPGCDGKGIIDLLIPFADAAQLQAIKDTLAALGFQHQTSHDPFPEDRPMRIGSIEHDGTTFQLHIHVVPASSPEVAELLGFRDRLRADAALRAAYVARKREIIAAGITSRRAYTATKGVFIQKVLAEIHQNL
jgi:GrpB-like predicted nucleotidyltransferase (UPF0157 family)